MKKRNTFLLIIFCIFFLAGGIYWRTKTWQENIEQLISSKSNFKFPEKVEIDSLFNEEESIPKEFVSPDGKLKVDYYSDWSETKENELKSLTQSTLEEKAKFLLLARKIKLGGMSIAFLVIEEIESEGKSLSDIIEEIKEEDKSEIEVIDLQIGEKEALLEAFYTNKSTSVRAKERLLLKDQKVYLIAILTPDKDWEEFREETERILSSARIIE